VAENWYPDWQATANDGRAQVLRGDYSLLTVLVRAGTNQVELTFHSRDFATAKAISFGSLALLVIVGVIAIVPRRPRNA
jgi:uncharacterized membrane protein YfhO